MGDPVFFFFGLVDVAAAIIILVGLYTNTIVLEGIAVWIAIILIIKGLMSVLPQFF